MTRSDPARYVAECYWSGIAEGDLPELDRRVHASAAEHDTEAVRYLGSLLILADEVLLFLFEGSAAAIGRAAERAGLPVARILRTTGTLGPPPVPPVFMEER
jgi:hypothetical protein